MKKEKLLKLIQAKEARKLELNTRANASEDIKELRAINAELESLNGDIAELRSVLAEIEKTEKPADDGASSRTKVVNEDEGEDDPEETEKRSKQSRQYTPGLGFNPVDDASAKEERAKRDLAEREKRGKDLKENRTVTVGSSNIILPKHQSDTINPTFNEVSGLIDGVDTKEIIGGESFSQPYVKGYGTADYTAEGGDYTETETQFGYADINKAKITAYAEDTEEIQKLPAAAYDTEVINGITIAARKKISREILVGNGTANHLVGIFSAEAKAIDAETDIELAEIDTNTLDEIVYSYGGDEDVEDAAVLILNKKDLKAFSRLRTNDGKKFHAIVTNGNKGTIDGIPFVINSACKSVGAPGTVAGDYCMAYGPLSNYKLVIFSQMDIKRSEDYKFRQGMLAHKGSVFVGGNVVRQNGFVRIKKAAAI